MARAMDSVLASASPGQTICKPTGSAEPSMWMGWVVAHRPKKLTGCVFKPSLPSSRRPSPRLVMSTTVGGSRLTVGVIQASNPRIQSSNTRHSSRWRQSMRIQSSTGTSRAGSVRATVIGSIASCSARKRWRPNTARNSGVTRFRRIGRRSATSGTSTEPSFAPASSIATSAAVTQVSTSGSRSSKKWFDGRPRRRPRREHCAGAGTPLRAPKTTAASTAVLVRVPIVSKVGHSPWGGFCPNTPQKAAGVRTEPPVSEPMAKAHMPAATATAEPLLEPPGARCVLASHGFHGVPRTLLMPAAPRANSTVLVLPMMTQPAALRVLTKGPSAPTRSSTSRLEPAVVGIPVTAKRSFSATGTPMRGPRSVPVGGRSSSAGAL